MPECYHGLHCVVSLQVVDHKQLAVSSLQSCIASALTAGHLQIGIAAAELVLSCLGMTDAQQATDALLLAQSCQAVLKMEALYSAAAAPQVSSPHHALYVMLNQQGVYQASSGIYNLPCRHCATVSYSHMFADRHLAQTYTSHPEWSHKAVPFAEGTRVRHEYPCWAQLTPA